MKIAIAGGSGLIGSKLTDHFISRGDTIYILTRNAANKPVKSHVHYVEWLNEQSHPEEQLEGISAFINLAGESIGSGRWTQKRKIDILQSRINATRSVIQLLSKLQKKPDVLINASAIGYYGHSETEVFTEESEPLKPNFLSDVVKKWESEARAASHLGVRVVFARLGIVLDKKEGALQQMILPYKWFAGGTVGSGKQWLSWIHIDDVIGMIQFAMDYEDIYGPFNLTNPTPVQMKEFGKTIASVLNRPHWIPAPSFALKRLLGEMSSLVLEGQKIKPEKALSLHYPYLYRSLEDALRNLLD